MKIEFRKISRDNSPFSVVIQNVTVNGVFKKLREHEVEISYNMQGTIEYACDICGENFDLNCEQSSILLISDGEYKGSELNVVETFDHYVNIDYIMDSEIEAFKSDYHYCNNCRNNMKE